MYLSNQSRFEFYVFFQPIILRSCWLFTNHRLVKRHLSHLCVSDREKHTCLFALWKKYIHAYICVSCSCIMNVERCVSLIQCYHLLWYEKMHAKKIHTILCLRSVYIWFKCEKFYYLFFQVFFNWRVLKEDRMFEIPNKPSCGMSNKTYYGT